MSRYKDRKTISKRIGRRLTRFEVVHHIDGNPDNGRTDNLKLMSLSDHSSFHMANRTLLTTTKVKLREASRQARPSAKLLTEDISIIRKMLKDGIRPYLIALMYGISRQSVWLIKTGECWGWV